MARRKRRTVAEFGPDPVDVHVGGRVRLRRTLLGMSQTDLADALAISHYPPNDARYGDKT